MFTQISAAALFAGLAAAYHPPVGNPSGNPITRPLVEIVPACKPFEITWTPTTSNTVSLVLLKGPSTNVVPVKPLVEGIANSGKFTWTPDSSLEATSGPGGYGLQIIDDVNGQYQYSTQFGISKDACAAAAPSPAPAGSSSAPPASANTPTGYNVVAPPKPSETKTSAPPTYGSAVPPKPSTHSTVYTPAPATTGAPLPGNGTVIQPTKPLTVPSSLKPTASAPAGNSTTPPQFPGAASGLQAGMGFAAFAAVVAALL